MHLGDRNSAYFHRMAVQRAARNHIHFFKDQIGRKIGTISEIKSHASQYFQAILGYTDSPLSPCSLSQLQELITFCCSESQSRELQKPVTEMEIMTTLFAMPLNKCPGLDGYSVEFLGHLRT